MINEIIKRTTQSLNTIAEYKNYETFINSNSELSEIVIQEVVSKLPFEFPNIVFSISGEGLVFADTTLYSVFKNLTINSISHGNSSIIDIEILSDREFCKIKFADNGSGIPDEIKEKIFDEGFHYGESGHTGIGLHIVKQTIERYGGSVIVENNIPLGLTFVIKLKKSISW